MSEFIGRVDESTDVFLFSPSIHNSAYFLNVFEHGEAEHPGLSRTAAQFFERIDPAVNFDALVSDSRNTVHSNYFIAKPRFWRAWLEVNEQHVRDRGDAGGSARQGIARAHLVSGRRANVQMKIFIMERVATWLLTRDRSFVARARDPFAARSRIYKLPVAIVCDALKIAYATQGRGQYKDVFLMVRNLRKLLNFQVRLGARLGLKRVQPSLRTLKSYWQSER